MNYRRQFLQITGDGAAGLLTGGLLRLEIVRVPGRHRSRWVNSSPDLDIALKAIPDEIPILPGSPTGVWYYQGQVIEGDRASLINLERSYLGPIIRTHSGQKVRIRFTNDIADRTIVHWHGLHAPADMDGHPRLVIPNGETYVYEFEVRNRSGTYWYHPHPYGMTGPQVYGGLAGFS